MLAVFFSVTDPALIPANAALPRLSAFSIVMLPVNWLYAKAFSPMDVTVSATLTLPKLLSVAKAPLLIAVTLKVWPL